MAGATIAPTWALAGNRSKSRAGVVLGSFRGVNRRTGSILYGLRLIDLDTRKQRTIDLGFFGHGIAFDPRRPHRAILFEKKGPGACEVDLAAGKVVRPLETAPERHFYGHGAFSKDGRILFATESVTSTHAGLLSVWDSDSLKPLEQFSTFGEKPHDCSLIDDGKTLVVTNGGGAFPNGEAPSVTFIDVRSRKLLDRLTFSNPRINAGHVLISRNRSIAVASAPRDGLPTTDLGALSLRGPSGALVTMTKPEQVAEGMQGETLSLAMHETTGHLAVTSPAGNQLSFWDLSGQKLIKALNVNGPRGVAQTLDGAHLLVSHGPTGTLSFYSPETLEEESRFEISDAGFVGSHLYTWPGVIS